MKWVWGICVALLFGSSVWAGGAAPLWEKYIKAKITFQEDLAVLLMRSHPEFEGLITTSRDLQITMTKMRQREYYYVLNTHPDKISRDKGAVQWANFKWTKAYEKALQGIDPEYAELMEAEAGLKVKNQGHPDWPAARAAFTEVMKTREYKEILKALMDKITGIDEGLRMTR